MQKSQSNNLWILSRSIIFYVNLGEYNMRKYKVLKSIAHNLAHSYFSLMNYIDDDYVLEHLFKVCKETGVYKFTIDVINMEIEPGFFMTETINKTLPGLKDRAEKLLQPEQFTLNEMTSFKLHIKYYNNRVYDLMSVIVDDMGKEHSATVVEWWKY